MHRRWSVGEVVYHAIKAPIRIRSFEVSYFKKMIKVAQ